MNIHPPPLPISVLAPALSKTPGNVYVTKNKTDEIKAFETINKNSIKEF